ncbi:hypothetical protein ACSBR2_001377 [Camellia fascicularis]
MFGIGGLCKAYGSLVSKRHHHHHDNKHPSPNQPNPDQSDHKFKSTFKDLNDQSNERRATNGVDDHFRSNGEGMQGGDDPGSPNHRVNNYFTSSPCPSPLSRSSSPNNLSRNSSLSRSTSRRSRTPTPVVAAGRLLKSISRKNGNRTASPEGGSLSRSSSRNDSTTTVPAGGGGSLSRSVSNRKILTPIMYSNSTGLIKPPAIEKNLECTLEEFCFGSVKKIMITRDVITSNGQTVKEDEEMLTIKVKPGWKKGTKITFEGMGNETPGTDPADIIFVIGEKRHPLFRREGDDLELGVEIPLVKALTGCNISVPLLGGEKMNLMMDDIIQPGYEKIIAGQGMPKPNEEGNRGNLIIKFLVQFPTELTDEQRANVLQILQDSC